MFEFSIPLVKEPINIPPIKLTYLLYLVLIPVVFKVNKAIKNTTKSSIK